MGFFSDLGKALDPTGNNFLGLGKTAGRIVSGVFTGGQSELFRTDPFSANRNSVFAKVAHGVGGAEIGAAAGFVTGGPAGAFVGGVNGGIQAGLGTQNVTKLGGAAVLGAEGLAAGAVTKIVSSLSTSGLFAAKVPFIGPVAAPAAASPWSFGGLEKGLETLLPVAFLSNLTKQGIALLPGTGGGSTGVTLNSPGPGSGVSVPSNGPSGYPGVPSGLQTLSQAGIGDAAGGAAPASTNWLLIGVFALAALLLLKKKRGH